MFLTNKKFILRLKIFYINPFFFTKSHYFIRLLKSILITCSNFSHYDEIMDSLMKAAENFVEETSKSEETFDESLFVEFMRKVPIWEFFCITKQVYLNMTEQEKREKISKYYSAMKNRHVPAGEFYIYFIFIFCFLSLVKMSLPVKNYKEVSRSFLNRILLSNGTTGIDEIDRTVILSELRYNNFNTANLFVIWWRIYYNQFNRIIRIEPIYDD